MFYLLLTLLVCIMPSINAVIIKNETGSILFVTNVSDSLFINAEQIQPNESKVVAIPVTIIMNHPTPTPLSYPLINFTITKDQIQNREIFSITKSLISSLFINQNKQKKEWQ